MPELEQPNFPTGVKPHLSPNPKLTHELVDGGRETPVIVVTEPKKQVDLTEESAEIEALREYVDGELAKKENLSNKSTSIGANPGNTKYPTELAVKNFVDAFVPAGVEYLTTAPTSANVGSLKFVVLTAEPATYYDGYYYIITEE